MKTTHPFSQAISLESWTVIGPYWLEYRLNGVNWRSAEIAGRDHSEGEARGAPPVHAVLGRHMRLRARGDVWLTGAWKIQRPRSVGWGHETSNWQAYLSERKRLGPEGEQIRPKVQRTDSISCFSMARKLAPSRLLGKQIVIELRILTRVCSI